jgi:hypothetical protein
MRPTLFRVAVSVCSSRCLLVDQEWTFVGYYCGLDELCSSEARQHCEIRNRLHLTSAVVLVVLGLSMALSAQGQPTGPQSPQQQADKRRQELMALSMPEAAKAAGEHYIRPMNVGTWSVAGSLESLKEMSEFVIVGEVTSARQSLSVDNMYINTSSVVRVVEVVKGRLATGSSLTVVTPGGRISFPDGNSAETSTPGMEGLQRGRRYVLFLEPIEKKTRDFLLTADTRGGYVPLLGPQGIFELTRSGVKAQGRDIDPVKQQFDKAGVESFLVKIRTAKGASGGLE